MLRGRWPVFPLFLNADLCECCCSRLGFVTLGCRPCSERRRMHARFQTGAGFGCPHSGAILAASAHLGLIILAKYGPACVQLSDKAEQSAGRERGAGLERCLSPSRAAVHAVLLFTGGGGGWGGRLTDEMRDGWGGQSTLVAPRLATASLSEGTA